MGKSIEVTVKASCYQHLPVGKQRAGVITAGNLKTTSGCPTTRRRIIEFRSRGKTNVIEASGHQHFAVGEQCRDVKITSGMKTARGRPGAARPVVQLRSH